MQINTSRFGVIEADDEAVISFPWGLPGFEHLRRFVLLPGEKGNVFGWLQSVESETIAFPVADPFVFFPGYFVDIPERDERELSLEAPSQALVLVIVSVPGGNTGGATGNLLAPLVINTARRLARQVILNSSSFTTRQPLFPAENQAAAPSAAGEGGLACWS
ncbi:MAG: flagellar assembly protein FliW [Peptococcaceae bacterium]|jgi:flagellar assembly factor FliW|nr:flagellar assembly protein FliW [Peptococcaceae bacterium]